MGVCCLRISLCGKAVVAVQRLPNCHVAKRRGGEPWIPRKLVNESQIVPDLLARASYLRRLMLVVFPPARERRRVHSPASTVHGASPHSPTPGIDEFRINPAASFIELS